MQHNRLKQTKFYGAVLLLFLLICVVINSTLIFSHVGATSTISQGYSADEQLPVGSIVSLATNTSDKVELSNSSNSDNILGVVINKEGSLLSLSNGTGTQVQVVTSGTVSILVSNINGSISRGDHITSSPVTGVGMKATGNVRVIGIAQGDFTEGSKQIYTDDEGVERTIYVGTIPLLVSVSYYFKEPDKTLIPSAIQNIANALAGRSVSALPIVISSIIFLVMIIIVASIVFSMVRSSIISVGRNPMSQSAIYRDLVQLSALVLVILAVGIAAIYLVLTRM